MHSPQEIALVSKLGSHNVKNTPALSAESTYVLNEADATGHAKRALWGGTDAFPARNMLYPRQAEWACLHLLPSTAKPPSYALISCTGKIRKGPPDAAPQMLAGSLSG